MNFGKSKRVCFTLTVCVRACVRVCAGVYVWVWLLLR